LCTQIGIADEQASPAAQPSLSAHPNPFSERTTIKIEVPSQVVDAQVRIVDAQGRIVTERSLGPMSRGWHRWVWDGRDSQGQRAPAGVYFSQVRLGAMEVHGNLLIIR
jgi:flagellar hook assembly protein FlgD